jgi:cytosine/adenosine deaminase-related metal-dependent hydrolase
VWVTERDLDILANTQSRVVHNPASNLKLGSGLAPIMEMISRGIVVGLGTDGSLSSDNQNVFEAMRLAALVGKLRFRGDTSRWIGSRAALAMATGSGLAVLGDAPGEGIQVGSRADLVMVRMQTSFLSPINDVVNSLVYSEPGSSVDTVLVGGRVVVENGRVTTVDEKKIYLRAEEAAERLRYQNQGALGEAGRLSSYVKTACAAATARPYPVDRFAGQS